MSEQSASAYTYAKLFPEQIANPCPTDAPESNTGPIAYLHALYQRALNFESSSTHTTRQLLAQRRPDIGQLNLDPAQLQQPVSALALVIHTLTHHAQERAGSAAYLPEVLANAGMHINVPFHYAHEHIKATIARKNLPLFELLQQADYSYPSFCNADLRTDELRQVMRNASGFSPALQELLLHENALRSSGDNWRGWYGMADIEPKNAIKSLLDVETFCRRTGLGFEQVLEMLAVAGIDDEAKTSDSRVRCSTAYRPAKPALSKFHYGAAYINARRKTALTIKDALPGAGVKPRFDMLDYDALPRIYQMIRLQQALALPFSDVDLLLTSILRAEGQVQNWRLSIATLRAIGVFRYLNEAYGITAEQFSALVCEVSAFAVGEKAPLLDRVLDGPGAGHPDPDRTLVLDDRAFDPADGADGQFTVLPALAKAMGIDEQTTLTYLAQVKQAAGGGSLTASLPLVSSLYRLTRLHRLLKRSARETDALLALLATTGIDVTAQLAGQPVISDTQPCDVLDILIGLSNLDRWLRQQGILPSKLLEVLNPPSDLGVTVSSALLSTLTEQRQSLEDMLLPTATSQQQEDQVATLLMIAFGSLVNEPQLTLQHSQPLLSLCNTTADEVMRAARTLIDRSYKVDDPECLAAAQLWHRLGRRYALFALLGVSAGALKALCDHPEWFDLEQVPTTMNLDLCYSLSRFKEWVEVCREHGADEADAVAYLSTHRDSTDHEKIAAAAKTLAGMIGWSQEDVEAATPTVPVVKQIEDHRATFDDFLSMLSPDERKYYDRLGFKEFIKYYVVRPNTTSDYSGDLLQSAINQLVVFSAHNPGALIVTQAQYDKGYKPEGWARYYEEKKHQDFLGYRPVTMEVMAGRPKTVNRLIGISCVPSNLSDIDFILRLKTLSDRTGLAARTLLNLAELNETSPYQAFEAVSQLVTASCDEALLDNLKTSLRERWRDALAGYLIGHWAPPEPEASAAISSFEELSSYCLTDIQVTSNVTTTLLNQAIGSLQHYLSRLLARLEPGYGNSSPSGQVQLDWQNALGQYGTWKRDRERANHPANLIYYANRPNKSVAFQELEVELNQGKMDTGMIHRAVCNYLTKFERVSNLQVISGYLDGHDPKQDTYHLIAKTNTTPYEYFWRTLDIRKRDDQERLSPLAWGEWEKITLAPTGEITQLEEKGRRQDMVRPVVIAGRRYVFWVERATSDLPAPESASSTGKHETLAGKRKLSVNFCFQQSDDTWSTSNELLHLDGYENGKWNEAYAKDLSFQPALIVVVYEPDDAPHDPWLLTLLYDGSNTDKGKVQTRNSDYFIQGRDLLLLEDKTITEHNAKKLKQSLLNAYWNPRTVQHIYAESSATIDYEVTSPVPKPRNDLRGLPIPYEAVSVTAAFTDATKTKVTVTLTCSDMNEQYGNWQMLATVVQSDSSTQRTVKHEDIHFTHELVQLHFDISELKTIVVSVQGMDYWNYDTNHRKYPFTSVKFIVKEGADVDNSWTLTITTSANQSQYLDLTTVKDLAPSLPFSKIRLNTLFGKNLVARATQGVERVLAWDTQNLQEPALDTSGTLVPLDFHGANALYFRELFLHVPVMIATRLTEQQQFEEAEDWYLRYLFNPYRTEANHEGRPAPWATRPLAQVGTLISSVREERDVVSRVFTLSRYYQQAVYLSLLENWQRQGDHFYRQLTLSSLNQAWLCYQQARQLLGPLPQVSSVSRWHTIDLASLHSGAFRRPLNRRVLDLVQIIDSRLFNLRHGLALDGKRLPPLDWDSESLDAFGGTLGGVSNLPRPYSPGQLEIPHYRFRQLLPLARTAAQQLSDFGRHYMSLMEEEFNTSLSVQLKAQDIKMAEFAIRLQTEAVNNIGAKKKGLLISRDKLSAQETYFSDLIDVGRSPEEEAATAFTWIANTTTLLGIPFQYLAGGLEVAVPTIYGMAVGGNKPAAPMVRTAQALSVAAEASKMIADELTTQASYNRRAAEWAFAKSQVEWDLKILDQQLAETKIELNASTIALDQCRQDLVHLKQAYVSMTTGFTIIPVYNWLVARQESIYGAAYDAVRSLCMGVEAAWRYEIGDYRRDSFIDTNAWRDNYKGMLVGESLLVNLQQMENEYLARNERRLTIKKSFSLKDKVDSVATKAEEKWSGIFKKNATRTTPLTCTFEFKADDFDKSYPGQYLRQLKYVSVTLVLKADKKVEELCAILKQTGSSTLLEADKDAARSFYPGKESEPAIKAARENPKLIMRNPRENQQIALSSIVAEDGLGYDAGTWVYELMFHDGRYLPFEGTGAISQWTLELMGDEALLKDLSIIDDIRFNMAYTAKAGDDEFVKAIGKIRKEASVPAAQDKS